MTYVEGEISTERMEEYADKMLNYLERKRIPELNLINQSVKTEILSLEKFLVKLEGFVNREHVSIVNLIRLYIETQRLNWVGRLTKSENRVEY